jgi:hypothetical protein
MYCYYFWANMQADEIAGSRFKTKTAGKINDFGL